jgi:hypothetical protein
VLYGTVYAALSRQARPGPPWNSGLRSSHHGVTSEANQTTVLAHADRAVGTAEAARGLGFRSRRVPDGGRQALGSPYLRCALVADRAHTG